MIILCLPGGPWLFRWQLVGGQIEITGIEEGLESQPDSIAHFTTGPMILRAAPVT